MSGPTVAPAPANIPNCVSLKSLWPLFAGIGRRPVLLAVVAVVALVAWGVLGDYYGLPDLFWNERPLVQGLAGFGAVLLLGLVCFVSYLLDGGAAALDGEPRPAPPRGLRALKCRLVHRLMTWVVPPPPESEDADDWPKLGWYLSVTWLPLVVLALVVPAIVYPTTDWPWAGDSRDYRPNREFVGAFYATDSGAVVFGLSERWCLVLGVAQRWPLLVGVLAALAFTRLFTLAFHTLHARLWRRWHRTLPELLTRLPSPPVLHLVTASLFVLLFALLWGASTPALVLLVGLWAAAHGTLISLTRVAAEPESARWKHLLAGAAFGFTFAVYQVLFLFSWLAPTSDVTALMSPALAAWLLLAMLVLAHGFLRFHFGRWYTLVVLLLLALGVVSSSAVRHRHRFPGLEGLYGAAVRLDGVDLPALADEPGLDDAARRDAMLPQYRRARERLAAHAATLGEKPAATPAEPATFDDLRRAAGAMRDEFERLDEGQLEAWKKRLTGGDKKRKPKLAVVTASGGANRSALWTAFVLGKLEQQLADFPRHLRVVTGASGGMVGAAWYTATLDGPKGHGFAGAGDTAVKEFAARVAEDHLTPVAQRLLFIDLPAAFLPRATTTDRGVALEESWAKHLGGKLGVTFADLAAGEAAGWRPSLILAPMLVEDGRRLLISNLYLSPLTESTGPFLREEAPRETSKEVDGREDGKAPPRMPRPRAKRDDGYRYSLSAVEFFSLFPESRSRFQVGTAVRMSATFPYVSPAVDLPTEPRRRVVDAGYYDNFGVNVAAAWLYHHRDWLWENTSGVVLIQLRDSASERRRLYTGVDERGWELSRGVEWLTGPLVGARSALFSIMSFRNDEQVEALASFFNDETDREFFTTVVFESAADVALSWYTTQAEVRQMLRAFDSETGPQGGPPNARALARLKRWWDAR